MAVVNILNATPKPRTTMYPTETGRGASPPKKDDCPAYWAGWLLTKLMAMFHFLLINGENVIYDNDMKRRK